MTRFTVSCICLLLIGYAALAQGQSVVQPPLRGLVTIVQPNAQFYMNIGSIDQLFSGATVAIIRSGREIGRAKLLKIDQLDSIGQLLPEYYGLRLQAGDIVQVITNPIPAELPDDLPYIEPDPSMRDYYITYSILAIVGLVSALSND